jgi:hypothetical protein
MFVSGLFNVQSLCLPIPLTKNASKTATEANLEVHRALQSLQQPHTSMATVFVAERLECQKM